MKGSYLHANRPIEFGELGEEAGFRDAVNERGGLVVADV